MHCELYWNNNRAISSIRCPVPGAIEIPAQLKHTLNAAWFICTSSRHGWLVNEGCVSGPYATLASKTDKANLRWSTPAILGDDTTKQTRPEDKTITDRHWVIRTSESKMAFNGPLIVGRSRHANVKLSSKAVSKIHAFVYPVNDKLHFLDLKSKNGSYLPPHSRIVETTLSDRDRINVAGQCLEFEQLKSTNNKAEEFPSAIMAKSRSIISRVAPTQAPVVITGESGVGKETVAKSIHEQSLRIGPLVTANSACFTPQLARSELFGHRAGSFTGATSNKDGLFVAAHQGTLFLDEIADMPLSVQAELLRALETGLVHPVGSTTPVPANPRVIAATHKDLAQEVSEGRFREDLFYRLFVVNVHVPPLRERPEDIEFLAIEFAQKFCRDSTLRKEVLQWLRVQPWKGNIRELRNLFWKAAVIHPEQPTSLFNLRRLLENKVSRKPCKDEIMEVFEQMNQNIQQTAEHLKIHRSTVHRHIRSHRESGGAEAA